MRISDDNLSIVIRQSASEDAAGFASSMSARTLERYKRIQLATKKEKREQEW
jgi:hypothetical protein